MNILQIRDAGNGQVQVSWQNEGHVTTNGWGWRSSGGTGAGSSRIMNVRCNVRISQGAEM